MIDLLGRLAENGVIALLLAIMMGVAGWLGKKLLEEKDKRIQDAKDNRDTIVEPLREIRDSLKNLEQRK